VALFGFKKLIVFYETSKNNGFYCADNRVVIKNNKDEKGKLKPFRHVNILFLLSSEYLNKILVALVEIYQFEN
jgi:hypothetical protein